MEALADYCGRALGPEPRGLVAEQCPAPPAGGPRLHGESSGSDGWPSPRPARASATVGIPFNLMWA